MRTDFHVGTQTGGTGERPAQKVVGANMVDVQMFANLGDDGGERQGQPKHPRRRRGWFASAAVGMVAVISAATLSTASSAGAQGSPPDLGPLIFERPQRGADAARLSSTELDTITKRNKLDAPKLLDVLRNDKAAWLDRHGKLFFVEENNVAPTAGAVPTAAAAVDPNQTFNLHSKPGSQRTIYLDFRGGTISDSAWNANYGSHAPVALSPFDVDGAPSAFSSAEHEAMQLAWQLMAEDFAPFDVNVTTATPAASALQRTDSNDAVFGTRLIVTGRDNPIYASCSCGGIAYVGVFDSTGTSHDYYQPALVFAPSFATGKSIAEAGSHEVGHNLGLRHDGAPGLGYYSGHGSWAPIMGVGYDRPVSQWSRGEYSGATNTEDDFAVMQTNGVALVGDDIGNTTATATVLSGATLDRSGLISTQSDVDVYRFSAGAGAASIVVKPLHVGGNLDIQAEILDANGALVAMANPDTSMVSKLQASGLDATLSVTLTAGTYYLRVNGVGFANPLNSGYTDYASVGRYQITGTVAPAATANQAPMAVASSNLGSGIAPFTVSFSSAGSVDLDGSIVGYSWSFGDGTTSSSANPTKIYAVPGSYTAQLTVTDNAGATGRANVGITVTTTTTTTVAATVMHVQNITLTTTRGVNRLTGRATVLITNANGAPVSGATVSGTWSGSVNGTSQATTNSRGEIEISSPTLRRTTGTFTFTVNNVTKSGATYNSTQNVVTTRTITV